MLLLCITALGLLGTPPPEAGHSSARCGSSLRQLSSLRHVRRHARPPLMRVSVCEADDAELRFQGSASRIRPISELVAQVMARPNPSP
jgi:hypothetical protein